ncbi:hypothetical protein PM3016_4587 [Paenibacillus mucilaginosus 3016]|uniref:Class I SAM-dependent methyltransferase n=1 Tax=Paenibacillus mucilaginosus 3016 TaxID=1116391 RepID=H6NDJ5_9BACL|nr:hypothetical protein [Paenibacillus mucilaginosus]AFC31335.1 hypothetical protein PM3016_4587 [Paenibacillus mucilaginosus 3016]WFA19896.1 hypothetical protein ERY13_22980 [Paenibacillus mucilaginosus]
MGTLDKRLRSLLNKARFTVRSRLSFSLGPVRLKAASKEDLFPDPSVRRRELEYRERYDFAGWHKQLGLLDYRLNLYFLELLQTCRPHLAPLGLERIRAVDVGSRTFYYLPALFHYYRTLAPLDRLHGVEFDAYRRYQTGSTAYDYAQAYLRELASPCASYLPMDFLEYREPFNVCTFFLPFVTEDPLLHWGLPLESFHPARLFEHAYNRLESPGVLIITNKGEEEQAHQHRILDSLGIRCRNLGPFESPFYAYDLPRYLTLVIKSGTAGE